MKLSFAGMTDTGRRRDHNEDFLGQLPDEQLFLVADGMGGHAGGEFASRMAVEAVTSFFRATGQHEEQTWPVREDPQLRYAENRLVAAIQLSNRRIQQASEENLRLRGMGTTIVAANFTDEEGYLGHVGDSRAYRIRNGQITQMTEDHSLVNELKRENKLSGVENQGYVPTNVITRALGLGVQVKVDIARIEPQAGDRYLLCSDGLHDMIDDARMLKIIEEAEALETACAQLIAAANAEGGKDNITVTLIAVH